MAISKRYLTQPPSASSQPRIWTPAAFRARCLGLMTTHGACWADGRYEAHDLTAAGALVWVEVSVASASVSGLRYPVRYDARSDLASCACIAATRGHPCWHAGVGLAYGRRLVEQRGEWRADVALARLLDDERWQGNAAALDPSL